MSVHYAGHGVVVVHGDCMEVLARTPEASVDAIVTDPPYGLGFMGRKWDALPPGEKWAAECLRVLKPGGHLLAFGGTRTWHRLAVAVEDAGFEIRDSIAWLYGSGFPKSHDVSKAIDKAAGAEREVVGSKVGLPGYSLAPSTGGNLYAATPDAERWAGWGTALKPAFEPVVVARKPLVGTVAANVLEHGTGALNIDGCRVPFETHEGGRWPANVVLDESQAAEVDRQSGDRSTSAGTFRRKASLGRANEVAGQGYGDSGGASRFFPMRRQAPRGRVYKRRGLEAALALTWATLWGTEPVLWAGRCYLCRDEDRRATRYPGRTQREAMTNLCRHLQREHTAWGRLARLGIPL